MNAEKFFRFKDDVVLYFVSLVLTVFALVYGQVSTLNLLITGQGAGDVNYSVIVALVLICNGWFCAYKISRGMKKETDASESLVAAKQLWLFNRRTCSGAIMANVLISVSGVILLVLGVAGVMGEEQPDSRVMMVGALGAVLSVGVHGIVAVWILARMIVSELCRRKQVSPYRHSNHFPLLMPLCKKTICTVKSLFKGQKQSPPRLG